MKTWKEILKSVGPQPEPVPLITKPKTQSKFKPLSAYVGRPRTTVWQDLAPKNNRYRRAVRFLNERSREIEEERGI